MDRFFYNMWLVVEYEIPGDITKYNFAPHNSEMFGHFLPGMYDNWKRGMCEWDKAQAQKA